LMPQLKVVLNELYERAVAKGHNASALRLFGTVCYLSMHRSWGLQAFMRTRSSTYLQMVRQHLESAKFSMRGITGWVLFLLSAGGRMGRVALAKRLLA
jgi:hypothetical protein